MAAVYLATHVNLDRLIALKVLTPPPDAEDPATFEERPQLEAETLASLDHPNIWAVTVILETGQTWSLPNGLAALPATDASFEPAAQWSWLTVR